MVNKLWSRKKGGYVEANGEKTQNFQLPANLREFAIFYYANVNRFKLKADSIKELVAENNVDILLLNETNVYASLKAINIKATSHFLLLGKIDRVEVFSLVLDMAHMKLSWSVKGMMQTSLLYG